MSGADTHKDGVSVRRLLHHGLRALVLIGFIAVSVTPGIAAPITYTYTGNTFGSLVSATSGLPPAVTGPYTLNDRVEGFLVFEDDLTLPELSHEWQTASPTTYRFTDGVQTLTPDNSTITFLFGGSSLLNGIGSLWSVWIEANSFLGRQGESNFITTYATLSASDDIGWQSGEYGRVSQNPNPNRGNPGTWSIAKVPEPMTMLLLLIGVGPLFVVSRRYRLQQGLYRFAAKEFGRR